MNMRIVARATVVIVMAFARQFLTDFAVKFKFNKKINKHKRLLKYFKLDWILLLLYDIGDFLDAINHFLDRNSYFLPMTSTVG
jgi:hypothetical protein